MNTSILVSISFKLFVLNNVTLTPTDIVPINLVHERAMVR